MKYSHNIVVAANTLFYIPEIIVRFCIVLPSSKNQDTFQ